MRAQKEEALRFNNERVHTHHAHFRSHTILGNVIRLHAKHMQKLIRQRGQHSSEGYRTYLYGIGCQGDEAIAQGFC